MSGGVPAGWVLVPVEQCDREAAADLCAAEDGEINSWARRMRSGKLDGSFSVQAFARHRLAATHTPPIEGRDADVERVDRAIEMVLHHSNLNGTTEQIEQAARQIRAALQALGERG